MVLSECSFLRRTFDDPFREVFLLVYNGRQIFVHPCWSSESIVMFIFLQEIPMDLFLVALHSSQAKKFS